MSKQELLRRIREEARKMREGEKAKGKRDALFEKARPRDDVTIEELAKAAGISVNGVKFARAQRRRKARTAA